MDRVEDWIGDFYTRHTNRCHREDWPEPGTEAEADFIEGWRHAFVTRGVERRLADVASLDMAGDPPKFLSDHLPTIAKLAIELRLREDSGLKADPLGSLEESKAASRDCRDCHGSGVTIRYAEERDACFGFACRCPMGRWTRARHGEKSPLRDDPYWLPDRRPPSGDVPDIRSPADLKAFVASLAASKQAGGRFIPPPPRRPPGGDARAVLARADLADAIPDPIIERERPRPPASTPAQPANLELPEDNPGWF